MDIHIALNFEWDENKRQLNLLKHGLDFEDARYFFNTPYVLKLDDRFDYCETRYAAIGKVFNREVVLIFSRPRLNYVRVISFRKANGREARYYYGKIQNQLEKN